MQALAQQSARVARAFQEAGEPDGVESAQLLHCSLAWLLQCGDDAVGRLPARLRRVHAATAERMGVLLDRLDGATLARSLQTVRRCLPPGDDLHGFYERLLAAEQPGRRRARGVYYTPPALCAYVLRRLDQQLREELGMAQGLLDPAAILCDPALGSGSFLVELVRLALTGQDVCVNTQVPGLLSRLRGCELMAPALLLTRLRMERTLAGLGYDGPLEGLQLHQGNALLDPPPFLKAGGGVNVIVGNPPYARGSRNAGPALTALLEPYKRGLDDEKNLQPLADDYIKFMRRCQVALAEEPRSACALVTNHSYLSGRLHRAMRACLRQSFERIDLLDLHGSANRRTPETSARRDENVFPISQGVAVCWLRHATGLKPALSYQQLVGTREYKLDCLSRDALPATVAVEASAPMHRFSPSAPVPQEYGRFACLTQLFGFHSVGGKPGDDGLLVGFDAAAVTAGLRRRSRLLQTDPASARTEAARRLRARPSGEAFRTDSVKPYAYRPFDSRQVYDDAGLWTRPVRALRRRLDGGRLLLVTRTHRDAAFAHVFATRTLPDVIMLSSKSSSNCHVFPESSLEASRLSQVEPGRVFEWCYALLHSPGYRARYASELASDYPRLPLPRRGALLEELSGLGARLLALHLLEASPEPRAHFVDGGDGRVLSLPPRRRGPGPGAVVAINDSSRFEGVSEQAWHQLIGGHQVAHKWLADRKRAGHALSTGEAAHYCRLLAALDAMGPLMGAIDGAIEQHGGWPAAFL